MKKILAIALTFFATSAIAEGTAQSIGARSPSFQGADAPTLAAGNGWQLDVSAPDRSIAASTASASSQVLYEVTLSRDGKLLKSFNVLTGNGEEGVATSEENTPYLASCDAVTGCPTGESHSGLMLSLTPRVRADGAILTSCTINIFTLRSTDDFSATSNFFMHRGQEMTISHNGLSLTIRAKVV
ncbi:hypothetical protein PQQ65_31920 [Paraburkholderia strydomiana]|uniref:hypothetical protein n=1 Tax=Paraburkholderia strydomiana TaxID=1245417 RepID=UPI0038BB63E9